MSMLKECPKCKEMRNRANFAGGMCRHCAGALYSQMRKRIVDNPTRECKTCKEQLERSAFKSYKAQRCMACVEAAREARKARPYQNVYHEGFSNLMAYWLGRVWQ